ncbi:spore cortex biosynthesis protein YabQ [Domibacillus sp. A3M-37]|uniref:spore cortex biosynthesis protein YabQ n=1 Tax=Domibacillus TaxID=1433999 RepID=UPI000617BFAF|nr:MULTISPECIES: spore cortex biosynthesis protein YabQ [Domibacillus]MCP3764509.1 spore cortex biosynthesis protein YabQ [Domibacillus sp. A3M-37]
MSLGTQFDTAIAMLGMGICFGLMAEIYHRIRPKTKGVVFLTDVLFWINYAVLLFVSLYYVNDGIVRLSFFLFWLAGCMMYITGLRRFILPLVDGLFFCIRFLYRVVYGIIRIFFVIPILFIAKCTLSLARMSKFLLLWVVKVLIVRPWTAIVRMKK